MSAIFPSSHRQVSKLSNLTSTADRSVPPPNSDVTKVEDSFQKSLISGESLGLEGLAVGAQFPVRPGYGSRGKKVVLWANYFTVVPNPALVLYRYEVAVRPEVKGRKLFHIFELLFELDAFTRLQGDIVTDYKSTIVSCRKLGAATFKVTYRSDGEDDPLPNAQIYQVRLEPKGTFQVSDLTDYLSSTSVNTAYADKLEVVQALNIFLRHHAKSHPTISTVGGSKCFSLSQQTPQTDLGAGLNSLRGFFSSIRVAACRILVNVNVSHGAFFDAMPLDKWMAKWGAANQSNWVKLHSILKGLRVKVTHLKEKRNRAGQPIPRIKTICGIATKDDGYTLGHPPKVKAFGAGAKDVEFLYDGASRYISVHEFFQMRKYFMPSQLTLH